VGPRGHHAVYRTRPGHCRGNPLLRGAGAGRLVGRMAEHPPGAFTHVYWYTLVSFFNFEEEDGSFGRVVWYPLYAFSPHILLLY